MMKRIISLVLCLGMIAGALLMAGCEANTTTSSDDALPMTLNFVGITEKSTTEEAIEATEEALNRIFKTEFKTKIELTLVTADEYIALIEERVAEAQLNETRLAAINKYNALAQKVANAEAKAIADAKGDKKGGLFSKWTQNAEVVEASTLSTGTVYTAEQTTVYADGKIETLYPQATSPIDILMIDGKEMYDYLDEKGYIRSVANKLETEFTKFRQYIYPTFLDQLKTITGDIKAIPNNNLLAEYTYLVVDKEIADKYDFDVEAVDNYADLDATGFLAEVAANENVTALATKPEALGIYTYFEGAGVGTYYDPIYGYDEAEGTTFKVQNLFDIPQYTDHLTLMETYEENGYFTVKSADFAVNVVKGDASLADEYADDYYVKVLQNPFVEMDAIFNGMLAVSTYTANETRALQIIQAINTDPEVKNILQYGIMFDGENEDVANYTRNEIENEDGSISYTVTRLNDKYMMDNALTGNIYMSYPEEGTQSVNIWKRYMTTNLDSALSPFMYFYVNDADLDAMLPEIIRRACLTEVFTPIGIDYDEYNRLNGSQQGTVMRREFKAAYIEYFISCLEQEPKIEPTSLYLVTKGAGNTLDKDFIEFMLSKEGQAVLASVGYSKINKNAASYTKKASMTGEIKIVANSGTELLSYIQGALEAMAKAYTELYPDVVVTLPTRDPNLGYNGNLTSIDNKTYTIGLSNRALISSENGKDLQLHEIAKSYLAIFSNDSHESYRPEWYENKMIEKITEEKYADIISASDLNALAMNKLATLAGITVKKDPGTESTVLAKARDAAKNFNNNIDYLRLITAIDGILFTPEEAAARADLSDVDFENSVFEFVRANYEIDHNLTEEDYVKLVQDFMASCLSYTAEDKVTKYTVSWDEFQEAKVNAQIYMEAATKIKDAYWDKVTQKVSAVVLNLYSLPEIMEVVYDVMVDEYIAEQGIDAATFEAQVMDIYLTEVGTNAEEFMGFAKTSDEYKNICSSLRKEYKKLLISIFGKSVYDKGESGIPNGDLLEALYDHFLEETVHVNDKMSELAGIDYETYANAEVNMENYDRYISTMKTVFVYTLRTKYTASEINKWSLEEAEEKIYAILYETGFYTNELAKYIGLELSDYMLAKSDAVAYQGYIAKIVEALAPELQAKDYNPTEFAKADGALVEEVCLEIVLDKYFSDKIDIESVIAATSADYVKGVETATDLEAYLADAKEATNNDYFYMAVINALDKAWADSKAE